MNTPGTASRRGVLEARHRRAVSLARRGNLAAASVPLRQDGNPLPEGPGRDGEAGSVRSMTADRTPRPPRK